jgi:hypothetical protein
MPPRDFGLGEANRAWAVEAGGDWMHTERFPCSTFAVLPRKRAGIGWITDRRAL